MVAVVAEAASGVVVIDGDRAQAAGPDGPATGCWCSASSQPGPSGRIQLSYASQWFQAIYRLWTVACL